MIVPVYVYYAYSDDIDYMDAMYIWYIYMPMVYNINRDIGLTFITQLAYTKFLYYIHWW